jgi:nucleotide-binding universal stress UspA family protein
MTLGTSEGEGDRMATIVCGVDDSPAAADALRAAADLSKRLGLRLLLVHVAPGYRTAEGPVGLTATQAQQGATRLLTRLASEAKLAGEVETRADVGDAAELLARIAAEEGAAAIVVGTSRPSWTRRGGARLARDLAAAAPCPVMIVPPGPAHR